MNGTEIDYFEEPLGYNWRNPMNEELKELLTAWLDDPELEGGDAYATLATLVSNLPIEMVNNVELSLKGLLDAVEQYE